MAVVSNAEQGSAQVRRRRAVSVLVVAGAAVLVLLVVAQVVARQAAPLLRRSVVRTLEQKFHAPVQLDSLTISVVQGLQVQGRGLRIAAQDGSETMIAVQQFRFRTSLPDLLHRRVRVALVRVDGLAIHLPPHHHGLLPHHAQQQPGGKPWFELEVSRVQCRNVQLVMETDKPGKDPLVFSIGRLQLTDVGGGHAMHYDAELLNPKPIGRIHAVGQFGPWNGAEPRATPVEGHYSFTNVDMSSIKGIAGTLTSTGEFRGPLQRLVVDGRADVPNFSLEISDHAEPLDTRFHATVDGSNGDVDLQPVQARLGQSEFTTSGTVVNIHGRGHDIALQVQMPHGRIQDMLVLAMKSQPPLMNGTLSMQARLRIPPGAVRVSQKIELQGELRITGVEFNKPGVQDRIDGMSLRAQGKPGEVKTVAHDDRAEVASQMQVQFALAHGVLLAPQVVYAIPGAKVTLHGVYSTEGDAFEFKGHLRTEATASQMVSGWKSWLLKPVDPFLRRNGAGVELPIEVHGSKGDVHFGLALHGSDEPTRAMLSDLQSAAAH